MTKKKWIVVILFLAAALCRLFFAEQNRVRTQSLLTEGDAFLIEGKLSSKEEKTTGMRFVLKEASVRGEKEKKTCFIGRAVFYPIEEESSTPLGSRIVSKVIAAPIRTAENEGGFDEKKVLRSEEVFAKFYEDSRIRTQPPRFAFRESLYLLKMRMAASYERLLPGEESGLMSTMALGKGVSLDDQVRRLFADSGLAHLLAVSSLHITIVGAAVLKLLKAVRLPAPAAVMLSDLFVILYAVFCGGSVSAARAAGMFLIASAARLLGEAYDIYHALALMGELLILYDPYVVTSVSFLLSFGAVFGVSYVGGTFSKAYEESRQRKWEKTHAKAKGRRYVPGAGDRLVMAMLSSFGLQLFTLPLVAFFYYAVPVYVIAVNLLLLPLLGILLSFGLLGGLAGVFGLGAARLLLFPCHLILYFYELIADRSLSLPFSRWVIGQPRPLALACYYVILILFIRILPRLRQKCIRTAGVSVFLFLFISFRGIPCPETDILSVGQGDGIFVDSGFGEHFFIDGGSSSDEAVGEHTIRPFLESRGISSVDIWFLSHPDIDHCSGFIELAEAEYPIKALVTAESIERNEEFERILAVCRERRIPVRYMKKGDRIRCTGGLIEKKSLTFTCLFPDSPSGFSGTNENSLVLHMECSGFDALFTGDIGSEQEQAILSGEVGLSAPYAKDGTLELLKAAHHGSKNSNGTEWLKELSPELTVFSAGAKNRYGHPSRETLERCRELGLDTLCTIDTGEIRIRPESGGRFCVEPYIK